MPEGEVSMLKRVDDPEEAWSIKQLEDRSLTGSEVETQE